MLPEEIGAAWLERFTREAASGKSGLTLPNGRPLAVADIEETTFAFSPEGSGQIQVCEPRTKTTISVNVFSAAYAVVSALAGAIAMQRERARQAGVVAPEYA